MTLAAPPLSSPHERLLAQSRKHCEPFFIKAQLHLLIVTCKQACARPTNWVSSSVPAPSRAGLKVDGVGTVTGARVDVDGVATGASDCAGVGVAAAAGDGEATDVGDAAGCWVDGDVGLAAGAGVASASGAGEAINVGTNDAGAGVAAALGDGDATVVGTAAGADVAATLGVSESTDVGIVAGAGVAVAGGTAGGTVDKAGDSVGASATPPGTPMVGVGAMLVDAGAVVGLTSNAVGTGVGGATGGSLQLDGGLADSAQICS